MDVAQLHRSRFWDNSGDLVCSLPEIPIAVRETWLFLRAARKTFPSLVFLLFQSFLSIPSGNIHAAAMALRYQSIDS